MRSYYAEVTRAAQTNDPTRLKAIVRERCPCYRPVLVVEHNVSTGLRTPDADLAVVAVRVHDLTKDSASAEVHYRAVAYDVVNRQGSVVDRVRARASRVDLLLATQNRQWHIVGLVNLGGV